MNHTAIFALYPNVVTIDDTAGSKDVNGDIVVIDESLVNAWVDPNAYKYARERAYPAVQDQLDMQYHDSVNNTTTWADAVAKVKTDNPKPA